MLGTDLNLSPSDVLGQAILTARGKSIRPKTLGQSQYVDAIDHNTIVFGIGQLFESFVLTPRVVGERSGLSPLAVIFALMAFGQLFGFVGVLVALPASAVAAVALRRAREAYVGSRLYAG